MNEQFLSGNSLTVSTSKVEKEIW